MTTAFQLAVDFVEEAAAIDPILATQLGTTGSDWTMRLDLRDEFVAERLE